MIKRSDQIRSMFAGSTEALSADNKAPHLPRVSAGSVRSLRDTFSGVERENEELRAKLAAGSEAVEIDPNLIDPSPHADRFDEQDAASFSTLKASIAEKGQLIPILVRPSATDPQRYQSAFGHRRVRAARALGITVKAYVRDMSDEDLVVAQGVENSARENLSFIERAMFAWRLEEAGFARSIVQTALSIDRAEASKLVSVAKAVPRAVVEAIGPAPKVGRTRWQGLASALADDANRSKRILAAAAKETFRQMPSDERFSAALAAATGRSAVPDGQEEGSIASRGGGEIGHYALKERNLKITLAKGQAGFASYIVDKLPELFETYVETGSSKDAAA